MKDTWIEPESGVWVIEGRSPKIEYSLKVVEEACGSAMNGLQKLSRGGIEVGGILFGEHTDEVVRILAWRPIPCEHSKGPAFILSENDQEALRAMLAQEDPALRGLVPVGWFVSHTKSEVALRHEDEQIYNQYFPEPWQVTLVLRPARHRGTDAGFFFREADGSLRTASSYKTFSISAFASLALPRESRRPAADRAPRPRGGPAEPIALSARVPLHEFPPPSAEHAPAHAEAPAAGSSRSRWILASALLLSLVVAAGLVYQYYFAGRVPPLAFRATDADGQIHIEWDHNSPGLRNAERGVLEITDGGPKIEHALTPELLRSGSYVYVRRSDDVDLRLVVYRKNDTPVSESSRFLGQPTSRAFASEIGRLVSERNQLRAEKEEAARKLEAELNRSRLLQQQVKLLQVQVDALRKQAAAR